MSGAPLMRAQARNNAWANHRLLTACAALDAGQFSAPRQCFYRSLPATLNQILTVDRFYVVALEDGTLGHAAWAEPESFEDFASVHAAQTQLDRRLITVCDALDEAALAGIIEVQHFQRERCDRLLLHLLQHQVQHRGQAHAMLGQAAPQLDEFYCFAEAPGRARELAALGYSEQDIWQEDS